MPDDNYDTIVKELTEVHAACMEHVRIRNEMGERIAKLEAELELTADKLSNCWLWIDTAARLQDGSCIEIIRKSAARLLRKQQAPGWKDKPCS